METKKKGTHAVTRYEVQSLMPAADGMEAGFRMDDGTMGWTPVIALAVAKVTSQEYDTDGRELGPERREKNEVVGLMLQPWESDDQEPTFAHEMICEEVSNFQGYRRVKPSP